MMKRYLIIGSVVVAAAILLVAGYLIRQKQPNQEGSGNGEELILPNEEEVNGGGGLGELTKNTKLISQDLVLNYFIQKDGTIIVVHPDGQISKILKDEEQTLSSVVVQDLALAKFSWDGKKVLVKFGKGWEKIQWSVFDTEKKTWRPLDVGIKAADWSPLDNRIAYFSEKNGGSLGTLDLASARSTPREILKIQLQDIDLNWVKTDELLLIEPSSAELESSIWKFNLTSRNLTLWMRNKKGLELIFDDKGNKFLKLEEGRLEVMDQKANWAKKLAWSTLPSKCFFSAETGSETSTKKVAIEFLNCAIHRDQTAFSQFRLPDDYLKKNFFSNDAFYKIKLSDGEIKKIFDGEGLDMINPQKTESEIFFINRYDNKLYSFGLK